MVTFVQVDIVGEFAGWPSARERKKRLRLALKRLRLMKLVNGDVQQLVNHACVQWHRK